MAPLSDLQKDTCECSSICRKRAQGDENQSPGAPPSEAPQLLSEEGQGNATPLSEVDLDSQNREAVQGKGFRQSGVKQGIPGGSPPGMGQSPLEQAVRAAPPQDGLRCTPVSHNDSHNSAATAPAIDQAEFRQPNQPDQGKTDQPLFYRSR